MTNIPAIRQQQEQSARPADSKPADTRTQKQPYRPYETPEERIRREAYAQSRHAVQDYYCFD